MHKSLRAGLGALAIGGSLLAAAPGVAHAAPPSVDDSWHSQLGCYISWSDGNGGLEDRTADIHSATPAKGFPGTMTAEYLPAGPVTDAQAKKDGYTYQQTVRLTVHLNGGLSDAHLSVPLYSSRVHGRVGGDTEDAVAFLSLTNDDSATGKLTDDQLSQLTLSGGAGGNGTATGVNATDAQTIVLDYTMVGKDGHPTPAIDPDSGFGGLTVEGFLNVASGNCKAVTDAPGIEKVNAGPNNDTVKTIPHTVVASDTGWVDGKRTQVLTVDDQTWFFSDHDKGVYAVELRGQFNGQPPVYRQMTVNYTEGSDPVTTTRQVPVYGDVTTTVDKPVTKTVTSINTAVKGVWVQADDYSGSFRAGTWDGKRQRKHAEALTSAERTTLVGLDDNNRLGWRKDRVLWGSATSKVMFVPATLAHQYGDSYEKADQHMMGWKYVDDNVTSFKPGTDVHKLWVLGPGADAAHPFGAQHNIAQTDIDAAKLPAVTVSKQVTTIEKVKVTKRQQVGTRTETTTTPGVAGVTTWSYSNPAN